MKTTFSITAIVLVLSSITAINGTICIMALLNQQAELSAALRDTGLENLNCRSNTVYRYCAIDKKKELTTVSCYLEGKLGRDEGQLFINNDPNNTGKWCDEIFNGKRILIVDIQKYIIKCVDDALA
ncbi:hypothetical protein BB561_003058 [Smittium simulii]|uniref:Uncharacterized protein n=1 Tax=Smittium simulii TaxID=133385 RepID=A0A2T9YN46_9FUNG|nr:hypothetical protein BB561_003058 [Smittium simulii]